MEGGQFSAWRVSLPLVLQSLAYSIVAIVDVYIIAPFGSSQQGALAAGAFYVGAIVFSLGDFFFATQHEVARATDRPHVLFWVGAFWAFVLSCFGIGLCFAGANLVKILHPSAEFASHMAMYMGIRAAFIPAHLLATHFGRLLIGQGHSGAVLVASIASIFAHIAADLLLVPGMGQGGPRGIEGAAWAAGIATIVHFVVLFFRSTPSMSLRIISSPKHLSGRLLERNFVRYGSAAALQKALITSTYIMFLAAVLTLPEDAIAANAIVMALIGPVLSIGDGVLGGFAAFSSYWSAKNRADKVRRLGRVGAAIVGTATTLLCALLMAVVVYEPGLMTDSTTVSKHVASVAIPAVVLTGIVCMVRGYAGLLYGVADISWYARLTFALTLFLLAPSLLLVVFYGGGLLATWIPLIAYAVVNISLLRRRLHEKLADLQIS